MKRKSIIVVLGVLAMLAVAGCGGTEGKQREDVTKAPAEDVTKAPTSISQGGDTEEHSYELRFSGKEEIEEAADGEYVYFKSSLYYPVFEGKYAENMNGCVASLTETFRESLPEAKESAKFDYEDSLSGEYGVSIFPLAEEFSVSCLWSKEQYMTLFTKCVSNTGGAHPNVYCQAYVVDLTSGCPEILERMLQPYGITVETLVEYATEKIREEHGESLYDYDDKRELEKNVYRFLQEHQWYFNDEGLVVFANPYEIAAYAYGMIECEISYEELEEGLKK